ncbi:MAG: hypothetical protein E7571_09170 [Ruminococcaceae bacterium]|nr:hypothetical protein [Oscillospiraceae bacterium]
MTKIVSITMAVIIMLTAGITAPQTYATAPQTITSSTKAKPSSHTNKKKKKHKHSMPKGNMGKWFKSKKALKKYVNKVMKKYSRQYENGEITWDEYVLRCPYGYEAWSCSCGKWSGNFKYHKVRSIDINYYIKYAKSYAKQIGLEYDKTATDCWDNPITVTTKNQKAVERDIKSRLDRYRNVEGFEGICVWAKTDGGDKYLLYIGYC